MLEMFNSSDTVQLTFMKQATILLVLLLGAFSCETTEPPPPTITQIQLRTIDASCTEVWLEVKLPAGIQPRIFSLRRDTSLILSTTLVSAETLIVDEGLLPNRQYGYTATRAGEVATSGITTLDTTSHEFVWEIDTLGDGGSSILYDVAIINDTLAYAVGEIYLRDSTGQLDPVFYNLARWNGSTWQISRIKSNCRFYYPNCGPETLTVAPGRSVFAFGPNDVWIGAGGVHRYSGSQWIEQRAIVEVAATNKIWGTSSQNLWLVGNDGLIVHYNGATWQRLESGTTLDVRDIWGVLDGRSSQMQILALASTFSAQTQESRVLQITGLSVESLSNTGLSADLSGIWFTPGRRYYAVGGGIHTKRVLQDSLWMRYAPGVVTNFASGGIRGTDVNNLFVVGSFREVVHFNGVSWYNYFPMATGSYGRVDIRENTVMAVGNLGGARGLVLRGRRLP